MLYHCILLHRSRTHPLFRHMKYSSCNTSGLLLEFLFLISFFFLSSIPAEISSDVNGGSTSFEGNVHNIDNTQEQLYAASHVLRRDSHGTHTSTTHSVISKNLDVEELEMLLEAYFVQIDGTLNKLSTVRALP